MHLSPNCSLLRNSGAKSPVALLLLLLLVPYLGAYALPIGDDDGNGDDGYDFVIVGAGTCGLVIANRLSELPGVNVLVIEAGSDTRDNVNVTNPDLFLAALGTPIDWDYSTVPQQFAAGEPITMSAGKAIGGTSTINGMTYTRTENVQVDSWEALGNEGWNWESLFPYYLKSQHFQPPTAEQAALGASYDPSAVGLEGPVKVGWTPGFSNSSISHTFNSTFQNLGIPWVADEGTGEMRGYNVWPKTADTELNLRADSAQSYYWPYTSRSNLKVMSNTIAHRVVWEDSTDSDLVASGVEITGEDGVTQVIKANQEVILSGGALKSPLLLELSGIGNPDILSKHDIDVQVPLNGVGEHLQDQTNTNVIANFKNFTFSGYPQYVAYASACDIFGDEAPAVAKSVKSAIPDYAKAVAASSDGAIDAAALEKLYQVQYELLFETEMPVAEILLAASETALVIPFWGTLPFAQGNIHISANNISAPALINPNYFMFPLDTKFQGAIGNYVRKTLATEPLKGLLGEETGPGLAAVPENATPEQWAEYLKTTYSANNHPVATAAMLPRELGGVVASDLKVYGTSNLRVVDASVLPQQLVGHLSSTLYAVAEKAADIIKDDLKH